MGEEAFLIAGALFLTAVSLSMVRIGGAQGGWLWALSWLCLYGTGFALVFAPALYAVFGTGFGAFAYAGAVRFAGGRVPRWLLPLALVVIAARWAALLHSQDASYLLGSAATCIAALAATRELARAARSPLAGTRDRLLAMSFPSIALTSIVYAYGRLAGDPLQMGMFIWLTVGIFLSGLQVMVLSGRIARRVERERAALATLIEAAPVGLLISDPSGRVQLVNRGFAEQLQLEDPASAVGRPLAEIAEQLGQQLEADHRSVLAALLQAPDAAEAQLGPEELSFRDGRVSMGQVRSVVGSGGHPAGKLWLLHDVSEERRLQEQLRRSRQLEGLGSLAGGVAHDFNNKLTAVLGNASMLRDSFPPEDPRNSALADLESAAEYCADLTRDLLDFARQTPRSLAPVDLASFLPRLAEQIAPQLGPGIELSVTVAPDLPDVDADRTQLERVVTNLLLNARDACKDGGVISVEAARARSGDPSRLEISVRDEGIGMDRHARERIFDPFYSTKAVGEGTGLGLAIVTGIVTSHGGEVTVKSAPGRGSCFTTTWPTTRNAAAEPPASAGVAPLQSGRGRVLLVEDEPSVRRFVRAALEDAGYDVIEAAGGREALALVAGRVASLDLAIIDLAMPGVSGLQTLQELRRECAALPTIIMSGKLPGRPIDGVATLAKPFRSVDLLNAVAEAARDGSA